MGWSSSAFPRGPPASTSRRAMRCAKFLSMTKPCCASWVCSATNAPDAVVRGACDGLDVSALQRECLVGGDPR
eukprot:2375919-Pyramimonas_sp.AAC.1